MRVALALLACVATAGAAVADTPLATTAAAKAAPARTVIVGLGGKTLVVTPAVLDGLDRDEATMVDKGAAHTYQGVRLTELLRRVDAPTGARLHATADRDYLVVTGGDGFRAVYSLAETDPSVQRHAVILADRMDGAPLSAHDAPYRLVVDGDQKPARSVYAVTKIELKALP